MGQNSPMHRYLRKIGQHLALGPQGMARLGAVDEFWRRRRRQILAITRWGSFTAVIFLALFTALLVVAHAWLPTVAGRKDEIAHYISQRSAYHVQIDRSEAYWRGLNPGLRVYGLSVLSGSGQSVVQLKEVRITLAWLPLMIGQFEINSLKLVQPRLSFERLANGSFRIGGLDAVGGNIPGQEEGFLPWLFQQNDVAVEDGEMQWWDHMSSEAPIRLSQVNLSLMNSGSRHQLRLNAVFPANMCHTCSLTADVKGDPLAPGNWYGEMDIQAEGLSTYALPKILREKLPAGLEGRFDVNLASKWEDGVPTAVRGHAGVTALKLALPGVAPFTINTAAADVKWAASSGGTRWRLELQRLRLGLVSAPWSAGTLNISHEPDKNVLRVQHVNVDDLNAFLSGLKDNSSPLELLRAIHPGGVANNLKIAFVNTDAQSFDYSVEGDLQNVRFNAYSTLPGVSGLTGHLSFDNSGGELALKCQAGQVTLPRVFQNAIGFRRAGGRVTWKQDSGSWRVRGEDLDIVADDANLHGEFDLRLPQDANNSPKIKLRLDFSDGNGAHAARYYPSVLHPKLRQWLKHAVVSGTVTSGHVIVDGALGDFPFRDGNGRFEVLAHVHDGVFQYLSGWPSIKNIDADLLFSGAGLSVVGRSGTIGGLAVGRVAVTVDDLAAPTGAIVRVGGQVSGPVDQTLAVLYKSDLKGWSQFLLPGLHGSGQGLLSLDLTIPAESPEDTRLNGLYEFYDATLYSPIKGVSLNSLNGALEFDRQGLNGGVVQGRFLGGNASLQVSTTTGRSSAQPNVVIKAKGEITDTGMRQVLGDAMGNRLSGNVPWRMNLRFTHPGLSLDLMMDLQQLGASFPAPLDKPSGVAAKLIVTSHEISPDLQLLDLGIRNQLSGRFALARSASGHWHLNGGAIEIGDRVAELPKSRGIVLGIHTPGLDADRWWRVIKDVSTAGSSSAFSSVVTNVEANVGGLYIFGRRFGSLAMTLARNTDGWYGRLNGDAVDGTLDIKRITVATPQPPAPKTGLSALSGVLGPVVPSAGPSATPKSSNGIPSVTHRDVIDLTLKRLAIPEQTPAAIGGRSADMDPRSLPELHIHAQDFQAWGKALGTLQFDALPSGNGWHFQTINLAQPNLDVSATGDWQITPAGGQLTNIQTKVSSDDFGLVLDRFGFPGEIAQGKLQASGNWTWAGPATDFSAALLNGSGSFSLNNGRLPNISPGGAGRLLGLIDTRALTRYLVLDFSNVFGKGFTFDSIQSQVTVENGNAYTQNLVIKGPSANIGITGRLGLATRDMDLDVSVVPRLGDQLTMTGILLGGPVVGAAVAVARDILKKPIEQSTRTKYTVKGSWDNPTVSKVDRSIFLPPTPAK